MGFGDLLRKEASDFFCYGYQPVYFNTGTIYDFEVGRPVYGKDKKIIPSGGFGNYITSVQGPGNVFKSTSLLSLLVNCLDIYPDSDLMIIDTEGSIISNINRLVSFSKNPEEARKHIHPVSGAKHNVGSMYNLIKDVLERRNSMSLKDLLVETPFINLETGKPIMVKKPFWILIDSWSEVMASEAEEIINKEGLDSKKSKTIHLVSGNKKNTTFQFLLLLKSVKLSRSIRLFIPLNSSAR